MRMRNRMPALCLTVATLLITGALLTVPSAVADDDVETCTNRSGDDAIAACTRAIASGLYTTRDVASFYVSRGHDCRYKGELDRAIQDFDKAIRLDPRNVPAFIGRGRAYFSKRQDDRTRQDFGRAIQLDAQATPGDSSTPVDVGGSQFMCCRAVLLDCRIKATWRLRDEIPENDRRCAETCLKNVRC